MSSFRENKIVVFVIVAIVAVGLLYYSLNNSGVASTSTDNNAKAESKNVAPDQGSEDAPTPAPTPPAIDTPIGWSAFTKEGLDYGFAHRTDWNIDEASNRYTRLSHKDFKIEIVRQPKNPDGSLEEYSQKQARGGEARATVTEQERITIDGFPALSETNSWLGGAFTARVVYVEKDNHVYNIVIRTSHQESDVSGSDVQTFLSNFKFSEIE